MKKVIEGLKILAGELLPDDWVFTSEKEENTVQCKAMVEWLNDTETNPNLTHLEGGIYYSYATEMAKRIKNILVGEKENSKKKKAKIEG